MSPADCAASGTPMTCGAAQAAAHGTQTVALTWRTTLATLWDLWPSMQHAMRRELYATDDALHSLAASALLSDLDAP